MVFAENAGCSKYFDITMQPNKTGIFKYISKF